VDAMFTSILASEPFVKAGRLKVLGYAGDKRASAVPDVATFAEQGIHGATAANWLALVTAAKTPRPVVMKLNEAVNGVLHAPDIRSRFEQNGLQIGGGAPEEVDAIIKAEREKISKLIKTGALREEH
jgi:tripartite-type tricarboxylate transporter receptor subunit TctC